ncbi:hypothetical protein BN85408830 [Alteracholeplasma palmae J233]|uniref:Uncharacterized protein n=1 Tax=Alteracholeplasma palmae (strain ATCC 49389 / J233) TaxID=1318466 RepID=U4KQA0_ALTPJ|nr:hypothetical protein [Alteracholeplasma palmae]CCV64460.1 hypothetical protein BN85408830 [Alteracholeplasma palmae J233]
MWHLFTEDSNFFVRIWEAIVNFFNQVGTKINEWLANTISFDQKMQGLYDTFIAPMPEIYKILGSIFILLLLVLGVISFIKKALKLFIVIIIIGVIIFLFMQFT